jgi:threonine synthase
MQLVCSGCDRAVPAGQALAFSCPYRGADDVDHVLRMRPASESIRAGWPQEALQPGENPFVRYRKLSYSWHLATQSGLSDEEYLDIVSRLSSAIEEISAGSVAVTPFLHSAELDTWIKNETGNVSGSHKVRHLIGTAIHLQVAEQLAGSGGDADLAIASCGNAALAAAFVARAAGRRLRVFLPPWAEPAVVARLDELGAEQVVCERRPDDPDGDPCYLRFREAVAAGATPFSCQGGDNALALIGGHSLGWELIEQSVHQKITHVFIQVGGGALASSIIQAYTMARDADILAALPRFHAVQTDNAHPLARAWQKLQSTGVDLDYARSHRSELMWPRESEPTSIATGILDDETYDWLSIVEGLRASNGSAVTVSESRLAEAQQLAQAETGIAVDATGTAGLAGLFEARSDGDIAPDETCLVLFTGALR